jgi:hypothetical protein
MPTTYGQFKTILTEFTCYVILTEISGNLTKAVTQNITPLYQFISF